MNKTEQRDQIIAAITASNYRWRTPRGIAKDSGLSMPQVIEALERADAFVRARTGNSRGEPLYTTKEKYRKTTSLADRIVSVITNKISD